jgi:hypothetical protein
MQSAKCPKCGHETAADSACPACGQAAVNGAARPARRDPPPPPEVAGWVIERPTPEMLEEARRTFDEAEYLAGVREIEQTGGVSFEEIMAEIERKLHGRN